MHTQYTAECQSEQLRLFFSIFQVSMEPSKMEDSSQVGVGTGDRTFCAKCGLVLSYCMLNLVDDIASENKYMVIVQDI